MCVQFHEQRLKACLLKRHTFQQCFQPESRPFYPRKRSAQNDAQNGLASAPTKQSRIEGADDEPEMKVEQLQQEGGNSSSSESQDELPIHFKQQDEAVRGHRACASGSGQCTKGSLTTYIIADGEDIVSSSGMEPDTGNDITFSLTSESATGTCGRHTPLQIGSLSTGVVSSRGQPPSQSSSQSSDGPTVHGAPSTSVKQESHLGEEAFAYALGRMHTDFKMPSTENDHHGNEAAAGCGAAVAVKHEAEDPRAGRLDVAVLGSDCAHSLSQGDKQQDASLPRYAGSPPLSQIRVESLQQQFEESFGIQSNLSLQLPDPHPVRLFAKSQRQLRPEVVENFLLDTPLHQPHAVGFEPQQNPEESGEGQSASSVLRHLLTRPYGRMDPVHESSLASITLTGDCADDPAQPVDEDDSQSSGQHGHTGPKHKMVASAALASQRHTENFLITVEDDCSGQDCHGQSVAFLSQAEDAAAEDNPKPFIKQEPDENVEDFSQAHDNSSLMESDRTSVRNSSSLPENTYHMFSGLKKQSHQSLPQSSATSSVSGQKDAEQEAPSSPGSHSRMSVPAMLPAEKLKSYSNMSLRDILTMRTEVEESLAGGVPVEEGEVVWECGFCHFADHDKWVVLAHRRQQHTRHMAQSGLPDQEADPWARSSGEEEEGSGRLPGDTAGVSARLADQPSASRDYGKADPLSASRDYGKADPLYSLSRPPPPLKYGPSVSQEVQVAPRSSRARGFRHDDDFEYLSEDSLESESGTEPEDLKDKNYIPPKSLALQEVISSEDEGETAAKKVSSATKRRRGRPAGVKNVYKRKATQSQEKKEKREESVDWIKQPEELYHCPFCHHPPASVQVLKNHIRRVNDTKHMLIARRVALPVALRYICPGDNCNDPFPDGQSYLSHVLQCQGHVLDSQESSIRSSAHNALEKVDRVAGFLNCPVSNCYFVSYFRDLMHVHLNSHVQQVRFSQMLLFRSICSAMAKTYAGVSGFDRYVCYCCNTILMDLPWVVRHVQGDHRGRVRGVLHVIQKVERKSRGIMVAVQCLKCLQRVPSLDKWFTHQCQPVSRETGDEAGTSTPAETASGTASVAVAAYEPEPCVPPFEEWLWRTQSSAVKVSAKPAPASNLQAASSSQGQGQLPLIRSILLAQPTSGVGPSSEDKTKLQSCLGEQRNTQERENLEKDDSDDDDDVLPVVLCDDCQKFVPEVDWKQHECFIKTVKGVPDPGNAAAQLRCSSATKDAPPECPPASRTKLLSVLTTHHQSDFPSVISVAATSASTPVTVVTSTPFPTSTHARSSSTHPSLVSLLTKKSSSSSGQPPGSQPANPESRGPSASQPPRGDSGMIRSLLTRSLLEVSVGKDLQEESSLPVVPDRRHGGLSSVDTPSPQPRETQSVSVSPSERWRRGAGESPSAAFRLQTLAGESPSAAFRLQTLAGESPSAAFRLQTLAGEVTESASGGTTSPGASSGSGPAPLVSFLRQQGDRVMQVLGNIFDDQDDASLL